MLLVMEAIERQCAWAEDKAKLHPGNDTAKTLGSKRADISIVSI